jgi:hypothetical protein
LLVRESSTGLVEDEVGHLTKCVCGFGLVWAAAQGVWPVDDEVEAEVRRAFDTRQLEEREGRLVVRPEAVFTFLKGGRAAQAQNTSSPGSADS